MTKVCSINRKGMKKEGTLEYQKGGKKTVSKIWVNITEYPSLLDFSKLCLTIEEKL